MTAARHLHVSQAASCYASYVEGVWYTVRITGRSACDQLHLNLKLVGCLSFLRATCMRYTSSLPPWLSCRCAAVVKRALGLGLTCNRRWDCSSECVSSQQEAERRDVNESCYSRCIAYLSIIKKKIKSRWSAVNGSASMTAW